MIGARDQKAVLSTSGQEAEGREAWCCRRLGKLGKETRTRIKVKIGNKNRCMEQVKSSNAGCGCKAGQ